MDLGSCPECELPVHILDDGRAASEAICICPGGLELIDAHLKANDPAWTWTKVRGVVTQIGDRVGGGGPLCPPDQRSLVGQGAHAITAAIARGVDRIDQAAKTTERESFPSIWDRLCE